MSRNATDINEPDAARDEDDRDEDAARPDEESFDVDRTLDDLSSAAEDLASEIDAAGEDGGEPAAAPRRRASDPGDEAAPAGSSARDESDPEDEDAAAPAPGDGAPDETAADLAPMLDTLEEEDRQRRADPEGWQRKQVDPAGAIDAILADVSKELDPPAQDEVAPLEGDFEEFEDEEARALPASPQTPAAPEPAPKKRGPSPLIALLVAINRPFANLSPSVRDTLGLVGVMTLLNALAVWVTLLWVLPAIPSGGESAGAAHKPPAAKADAKDHAPAKGHAKPEKKPAASHH